MIEAAGARDEKTEFKPYELWRPIIRPRRRHTLERIHANLAEDWSTALRDFLERGEQFEFVGLSFENFQNICDGDAVDCQTASIAIEKTEIVGFLLLDNRQARSLIDARLGMGDRSADSGAKAGFSRIESAILRDAIGTMLARLGNAYAGAGLGRLVVTRQGERLKDTVVFGPQDYLVILRFRVGGAPNPPTITVALSSNIINAVRDFAGADRGSGGSERMRAVTSEVPIAVDLVLGSWTASIAELRRIRVGDGIVLPDGEDAWLAVSGVRLAKVSVRFDGAGTAVEIRRLLSVTNRAHQPADARVVIDAVIARLTLPTRIIASIDSGDEIEIVPEVGCRPMVRFVADGTTLAVGSLADDGDRLTASITGLGAEPTARKNDRWLFRKKEAAKSQ